MKKILAGIMTIFLTANAYAQNWEADMSKIGASSPGGFDYQLDKYTEEEVGKLKELPFSYEGTRTFRHAPAPGIHPRIYFNPEEREDIIRRLKDTRVGKETARLMRAHAALVNLPYGSGGYTKNKSYSKNEEGIEYISNPGMFNEYKLYNAISDPHAPKGLLDEYIGDGKKKELRRLIAGLSCEAFECYLHAPDEKDIMPPYTEATASAYKERAEKLARAMTYWAKKFLCCYETQPKKAAQRYGQLGGMHMAVLYDINYWAMTDAQRETVRKAIALTVPEKPIYGTECEPFTTTSNWTTLNFYEIIPNLAIEGEPGYRPEFTKEWVKVLYKFVNYGFYADGFPWEGLGKNYLMTGQLNALARRGYSFLGHPHVRNFTCFYLAQIAQPFGYAFIGDDLYGGTDGGMATNNPEFGGYRFHSIDAIGLNYAYPNDPGASFVWRNFVCHKTKDGKEYIDLSDPAFSPGTHNYFDRMAVLISYADDWHSTKSRTELHKLALKGKTDYLSDGRGLVILRSGFGNDDMHVQFNVRQNFGGHTSADRNDFTLSALGRIWIPKEAAYGVVETDFFSCILVNGKGIHTSPDEGVKSRQPAKIISYKSDDVCSAASGDATYAYNWDYRWKNGPAGQAHPLLSKNDGWEKVSETLNDFMYVKNTSDPYYDKPFYEFGSWNAKKKGDKERMVKKRVNNMERVIRNIALSKGEHPFLVVADDIKKEKGEKADYISYLQMATDVSLDKIQRIKEKSGLYDIIVKDNDGRRLLIRVIGHNNYLKSKQIQADFGELKDQSGNRFVKRKKTLRRQRIALRAYDVSSPDFKLIIFPLKKGEALPETEWNKEHTSITVNWGNKRQEVTFNANKERKNTEINIRPL